MSYRPAILSTVTQPHSFLAAAPVGPHALEYLRAFLAAARAGDPLSPVTVVAPSNYAALSLRRLLGSRDGLVNVRFLVLSRVAELLAAADFVPGRRPLTPWIRAHAVRLALEGHGGVFERVRAHPGAYRALDSTFRELRQAAPGALHRLASVSPQSRDVVELYERYREFTADYFDTPDLLEAAAAAVERNAPALRDLGRIVLYLPRYETQSEFRLVSALASVGRLDAVLGLTGDSDTDDSVRDIALRLGANVGPQDTAPPVAHHIIDAVDTVEEARAVVAAVLRAAHAGTPLHRIAVLFPSTSPFPGAIAEQLRAAGLPFHGPGPGTLATSMSARVLTGLLALPAARFRRKAIMDWLASGPIRDPHGGSPSSLAPSAAWEEISREAGVVVEPQRPGPVSHWQRRLDAYAMLTQIDARKDVIASLAAFVDGLKRDLEPPAHPTPAVMAEWARTLLVTYLGPESAGSRWGDEAAAQSHAAVLQTLEAAAREAGLPRTPGSANPRSDLASILESALAAPDGRLGPFGDGLYLAPIQSARGMDFDQVFVLGMVEGIIPAVPSADPLLLDSEREEVGLPPRIARATNLRSDYLCALAAAPHRTLSFARSDVGTQSRQRPSRWLMETVASLAGHPVAADTLPEFRPAPWLTVAASFERSITAAGSEPLSLQEWELAAMAANGGVPPPFLAHGSSLESGLAAAAAVLPAWARRAQDPSPALSPWAGGAGPAASEVDGVYSPTSFETLARCPFRYFLGNILRVKETVEPGDVHRIEPADRGTVVHDALEQFLTESAREGRIPGPAEPWPEAGRQRLLALADDICDRFEAAGKTGGAALWYVDRARIRRDLSGFLDADDARRAATGASFLHAEFQFGRDAARPDGQPHRPPVRVALADGTEVLFRGQIDRVDRTKGGELIVYDYKTGSIRDYKALASAEDRLSRGRHLQLPVYALAARAEFGDVPVSAYYWAVSEAARYQAFGYTVDSATIHRLGEVLSVLVGLVRQGLFPQVPGKQRQRSYENCRYCPFDRVCPSTSRTDSWDVRRTAPGIENYVALIEAAAEDADSPEAAGD